MRPPHSRSGHLSPGGEGPSYGPDPPRARRLARALGRLALLLVGLALALLGAEGICRILGLGSPVDNVDLIVSWEPSDPYVMVDDPNIGFTFKPGYEGRTVYRRSTDGEVVHVSNVRIGPHGVRERPRSTPARRRVLALGDSVTFGLGVEADEAWPASLERHLGGDLQVLSAGVPGWNIGQMSAWLAQEGWALDPSLVVLAFYMNDLLPPVRITRGAATTPRRFDTPPWARREAGFRRTSWLYNEIWRVWDREQLANSLLGQDRSYLEELLRTFHEPTLARYYLDFAKSCAEKRVPCAVAVLPFFEGMADATAERLLGLVEASAKGAGVTVLRVDHCLDDMELARRIVLPGERHASAAANEVIGQAVAEGLREKGVWR